MELAGSVIGKVDAPAAVGKRSAREVGVEYEALAPRHDPPHHCVGSLTLFSDQPSDLKPDGAGKSVK